MKKIIFKIQIMTAMPAVCCIPFVTSCGCQQKSYKVDAPKDDGTFIKDTDYTKVFVISGQSNAQGCSKTEYLKENISEQEFNYLKNGISKVQTTSCCALDSGPTNFVPTACSAEYFGPEVGFADMMTKRSNQKVYVIKYAWGGTGLDVHWMDGKYKRGKLYNNLVTYIKQSFAQINNAKLCGVCWMQGESDADPIHAKRYYENTSKFVSFLRQDLKDITIDKGFVFVDAGITYTWYKWDEINAAKIKYWKTSNLNGYFSTAENGLTVNKEPKDKPDTAHYDSLSELQLGRWFALKSIELFNKNN